MFPFTRRFILPCSSYAHVVLESFGFSSVSFRSLQRKDELCAPSRCDDSITPNLFHYGIELPQLLPSNKDHLEKFNINLVDPDLWLVSFALAHTGNVMDAGQEKSSDLDKNVEDDEITSGDSMDSESPEFDEIEDLRLQKKLFYKLDRGSKEYEECKFSFHRRKSFKKCYDKQSGSKMLKQCKKSEKSNAKPSPRGLMPVKEDHNFSLPKAMKYEVFNEVTVMDGKKLRTPTFNQLTDPYHLPFCLDIFITKGSVRACVIHRVSSKVVAVAHSISKDMKFDLSSKKDATACAAVGEILAQRAIEDDIHNVVYTPRKGDKIEGKLQIVLESIIDHGINVKIKLKQKRPIKVKADKYAARNCFEGHVSSPGIDEGSSEALEYSCEVSLRIDDINPCLTPCFSQMKSKDYEAVCYSSSSREKLFQDGNETSPKFALDFYSGMLSRSSGIFKDQRSLCCCLKSMDGYVADWP